MKQILISCLALAFATSAPALTINLVKADNADTLNPSFDPTLSKLEDIMVAAADYWTDVIKDDHTTTIVYGYQNHDNAILGLSVVQAVAANGHASLGAIAFDTRNSSNELRPWFFDPTPKTDEEFEMSQVLVADLTPQTIALYYEGTPPDQLEVGYWGNFINDTGDQDIYTTALHEIGHLLGMSDGLPSYIAEIASDETVDFSPSRVGGNLVEAHIFAPSGANRLHLRASDALMSPGSGNGDRNLPSATDIFAVASGGNWTDYRLKRVNFLSGNSWGFPLNWSAGQVPSKPQRTYISHGETVDPPGSDTLEAGTLTIVENSVLNIGTKTLDVKSTIDLGLLDGTPGTLTMGFGGKIEAGILSLRQESRLVVNGGIFGTAVDVDQLRIASDSQLIGTGHILADYLETSGSVIALALGGSANNTLLLNSPTSSFFPGLSQPVFRAELGNLAFATAPDFNLYGTLHIGAERKATFLEAVTHPLQAAVFERDRVIKFNGGTDFATAATLEVPKGYIGERATIEVEGYSQILGDATFLEGATVDLDAGSTLLLNGETTFRGGTYRGEGTLRLGQVTTVEEDTTIDCDIVGLDGSSSPNGDLTINDSQLTLNTDRIDDHEFENYYNGTMTLDGDNASLNVHQTEEDSWTMWGSLLLNRSRDTGTMLTGDTMILWGDLRVNGVAQSTAPIHHLSGTLNIPGVSSSLVLSNQNCIFWSAQTTTGNGSVSISQKGGLAFEFGSDCSLRVANAGVMTLGLEGKATVGSVQISDRFTQAASGILEIDLAGESSSDLLVVTSSASMAGTLRLRYQGGYRAEVGHSFDILTAADLIGTFDAIEGPDGQRWEASYNDLTNTVSVTVTATAYEVWVDENGLTENINDGFFDDPDGDGDTNIKEFALNGNPLDAGENCRFYLAVVEALGGQIFTVTFPVRKGAEFSVGPQPEATIDAIRYRVEGSEDLMDFNFPTEPYPTVLDDDLPALPAHYEYLTFRTNGFIADQGKAFLRLVIQPTSTLEKQ